MPPSAQDGRRASATSGEHKPSESYGNVDDSLAPTTNLSPQYGSTFPPRDGRCHSDFRTSTASQAAYDVPDTYANLDEAAGVWPVQNPHEQPTYRFRSLEQVRSQEQDRRRSLAGGRPLEDEKPQGVRFEVSRLLTQLYTVSYLIFFSILGTLARLGLQALTNYPGTPIGFSSIWPNFAGSLVMGFLAEDRKAQAAAVKKTIPLYIGLATGFCGSFTSFSAFIRDMFLALSNDLDNTAARNGGYSFLTLLAVPIVTVSLSLGALVLGAHLAIALAPLTPSLPRRLRATLDKAAVFLGWGCWLGAVLLSIFPPPSGGGHADWRGKVTFALVFAPPGCLVRFYASLKLNGRVAAFPVGTFVVNLAGTGVLAMAWDLAHSGGAAAAGQGLIGCQVLAGVQDGFCGCLTTVSTWVGELAALRRRHAYVYGGASVLGGFAVVVAIMGGLRWSESYEWGACG
ncbi:CrcB-like protein-domain-containing protein [Chaetomium strumarium]|uniref:CrcB-like protein-domain-containing protein n=1 Tax=Chaetomium strumarium TaxID=1170767 RepID=A0AAJ0GLV7_9PEZI|nr:CrcB-like protein-domain-containing protein [Chaetomium strumarium]